MKIFVDESGTPNLQVNKPGAGRYYIVVGVSISADQEAYLRSQVDILLKRFFGGGKEIKSSNVANNKRRRIKILSEMSKLPIRYYALVIDKRELREDSGLRFKQSFYKFINGLLYQKLYKAYHDIEIIADECGRNDFMMSFKRYIGSNHQLSLFKTQSFRFIKSHKEKLIGLADFIAGSISKSLTGEFDEEELKCLSEKCLLTERWPPRRLSNPSSYVSNGSESFFDTAVQRHCYVLAVEYVHENADSSEEIRVLRSDALRYILGRQYEDDNYIFGDDIIRYIHSLGFDLTKRKFMQEIIGGIRDSGVVLASSNEGYRVPTNVSDLYRFISGAENRILPYARRLKDARSAIIMATNGALDIIDSTRFPELKRVIDACN